MNKWNMLGFDFKKITDSFPLISVFLIISGYIHLSYYYGHWGINIAEYLTLSEIILSFLAPGLFFVAFLLGYLLLAGAFGYSLLFINEYFKRVPHQHQQIKEMIFFPLGYSLVIGLISYFLYRGAWVNYHLFWIVISILFLCWIFVALLSSSITVFNDNNSKERLVESVTDEKRESNTSIGPPKNRPPNHPYVMIPTIIFLILTATIFYTHNKIHNTETTPGKYVLHFKNDSLLKTDSNLIFLGKTEKHYFIYSINIKEAKVFSADEIKVFSIQNK